MNIMTAQKIFERKISAQADSIDLILKKYKIYKNRVENNKKIKAMM